MLEHFLADPAAVQHLRSGALGSHVDAFLEHLAGLGYAHETLRIRVGILRRLARWMARHGVGVADLSEAVLKRFSRDRAREGGGAQRDVPTVRGLLVYLRSHGATGPAVAWPDASPLGHLQRAYDVYLAAERALAPVTRSDYCGFFRQLLSEHFGAGPLQLRALTAADITTFVRRHAHTISPGRAKLMVTALRSMLRFLLQRGLIDRDLAASVPAVATWRLTTVPKYLRPEEIDRLLDACDRTTAGGRRDHAILLLLARLGLRAGEVAALELGDIHWRAGEISVRGSKTGRCDRLPLPADVGAALAAYVRADRPRHRTRRVFLCTGAPTRGFAGARSVSTIVRRTLDRAGLHPSVKGAHLLRHSLATQLLRAGASLSEIGQVLRHRAVTTTEIYAKVDLVSLSALARPWPVYGGEA
jgi:site-specific recombinase XerD